MQIARFISAVAFILVTAVAMTAIPVSAQHRPMHTESMPPRHANIVVDARGRSFDEALDRQKYRGPAPTAVVTQTGFVNAQQMLVLGFRKPKANATGLLVEVDVHDATGNYQDFYVYDQRTHFVTNQIEKIVLPKTAVQTRIRKP